VDVEFPCKSIRNGTVDHAPPERQSTTASCGLGCEIAASRGGGGGGIKILPSRFGWDVVQAITVNEKQVDGEDGQRSRLASCDSPAQIRAMINDQMAVQVSSSGLLLSPPPSAHTSYGHSRFHSSDIGLGGMDVVGGVNQWWFPWPRKAHVAGGFVCVVMGCDGL
jgi:hypothetical protein